MSPFVSLFGLIDIHKKNPSGKDTGNSTTRSDGDEPVRKRVALLLCIGVMLLVVLIYAQTARHDFIYCDDDQYIFQNPQVQKGLTVDGFKWAFTRMHAANWHPLTWLSHMLDVQIFGLDAGAHHMVNMGLHAINAVLLFLAFRMMTGAFWPSVVIASLFALHPLRVESVAWAAERKDILSGLFWILTLITYTWYAKRPGVLRYFGVMVLTALGLMSKSMLVTLPCVLLLLDVWPLGRWQRKNAGIEDDASPPVFSPQPMHRLIMEKLPLLSLSAASSVITVLSQKAGTALGNLETLPFAARLSNAVLSYVLYIWKTIWPTNLAIFYPHSALVSPETYSALNGQVIGAFFLLILITFLVVREIRGRPYLAVGWFWYLGTMVPVIGLVQVGMQAMADRYTYLPLIGIYIMAVWGLRDLTFRWSPGRRVLTVMTPVILAAFITLSWFQIRHWKNSQTIFEHALRVTSSNYFAHNHLGRAFENQGALNNAAEQYEHAVRIKPDYAGAHSNLGNVLAKQGKYEQSVAHLKRAIRLDPKFAAAYSNLGLVFDRQGRPDLAVAAYVKSLQLDSQQFAAHYNLGVTLVKNSDLIRAAYHLEQALQLNPFHTKSANDLGVVYMRQGNLEQAEAVFKYILRLKPDHVDAHCNLGTLYQRQDRFGLAITHYSKALNITPVSITALYNLGVIYEKQGHLSKAMSSYEKVLRLDPDCIDAHRNLGFMVARHGNPDRAFPHMEYVLRSQPNNADAHNAMGFICAQKGDFDRARSHFKKALHINPNHVFARKNLEHLDAPKDR